MGLFDWWNKPPRKDAFAKTVMKGIRQAGETRPVQYNRNRFELVTANQKAYLGNAYHVLCTLPKVQRAGIVQKTVRNGFVFPRFWPLLRRWWTGPAVRRQAIFALDELESRIALDGCGIALDLPDPPDSGPAISAQEAQLSLNSNDAFPFSIADGRFYRDGQLVFLNIIAYQPLEPGDDTASELNPDRVGDDLRRLQQYQSGNDPLALRVYSPNSTTPQVRMTKEFCDRIRATDMWLIRDIYFGRYDDLGWGRAWIDAAIAEVESAGALDRIFAWEIQDELPSESPAEMENFLEAMRDHIKTRMSESGREDASDWVTWGSWPPADLLRTDGNPIDVELDFYSINSYSYEPDRLRDHQAGPVTGTPYAGWLRALHDELNRRHPGTPLVISETGLPDSPMAADAKHELFHSWYPQYRKGNLNSEQVYEGLVDRYMDARLTGLAAGLSFFEWNDEWWKAGAVDARDGAEDYFGLARFEEVGNDTYELRYKLQQEAVHDLFTLDFYPDVPVATGITADDSSLELGGHTMVHANVNASAPGPLRFRWESNRGRIVGDGQTVKFFAGETYQGPAEITVLAIDAQGNASQVSTAIDITPSDPELEILTLAVGSGADPGTVSGRLDNVNLDTHKLVLYVQPTPQDQFYVQPFTDVPLVFVRPDGYWWSKIHYTAGEVFVWAVPNSFAAVDLPAGSVPPAGTVVQASTTTVNDADKDLLPDDWEWANGGYVNVENDRYRDPDGNMAYRLEEFLAGTTNNDQDSDGLWDNWERQFFTTIVAYDADDDPDFDGIPNSQEQAKGIHPGRTAADGDQDGLPDLWERRHVGNLDPSAEMYLTAYELAQFNDKVGVHRGDMWYLDCDSSQRWNVAGDKYLSFGILGDEPIVGDWNGDGYDEVGVHRGELVVSRL